MHPIRVASQPCDEATGAKRRLHARVPHRRISTRAGLDAVVVPCDIYYRGTAAIGLIRFRQDRVRGYPLEKAQTILRHLIAGSGAMDEILINKTTTGDQQQPGTAGLTGLQFAVAWADRDTGNIKGRLFGVNGVPSGDELTVSFPGTPGTKRHLPTIMETRRGLATAWIEQPPGAPSQLKLRTLDQDTLSGPESQVSTAEVEPLIRPALARLPDGGFIVVWADKRANERIRAQRYDIDGMKNGPEFRANTVPGLHRVPMVASLRMETSSSRGGRVFPDRCLFTSRCSMRRGRSAPK